MYHLNERSRELLLYVRKSESWLRVANDHRVGKCVCMGGVIV